MSDGTDSARRMRGTGQQNKKKKSNTLQECSKPTDAHGDGMVRIKLDFGLLKKENEWILRVRKDILHDGASLVHLLWHFNLRRRMDEGMKEPTFTEPSEVPGCLTCSICT